MERINALSRKLPWYVAQSSKLIKERYGMESPHLQDHDSFHEGKRGIREAI